MDNAVVSIVAESAQDIASAINDLIGHTIIGDFAAQKVENITVLYANPQQKYYIVLVTYTVQSLDSN